MYVDRILKSGIDPFLIINYILPESTLYYVNKNLSDISQLQKIIDKLSH